MVIIYLPNGNEAKFTTSKDVGGKEYQLVDTIVCDDDRVSIAYKDNETTEGESYVGMPYYLNIWK